MNPNGPERRATSPKGEAVREHVREALAEYEASRSCGSIFMEFTASELARMFGRLWATAYAQGYADAVREMRESLGQRIDEVLGEMRLKPTNVTWDRYHRRWKARVQMFGRRYYLGRYIRRETAVEVVARFKEEVRK